MASNDAAVITGDVPGFRYRGGWRSEQHDRARRAPRAICLGERCGQHDRCVLRSEPAGTATVNGYGSYAVTAAGVWTYTLDNSDPAVQALNVGSPALTDSFTVKSEDGTEQTVTITINGSNDAATVDLNGAGVGSDATASFTEQTPVVIAPAATIMDVDSPNLTSLTVTLTTRPDGNAESLSLNAAAAALATSDGLAVTYTNSTGVPPDHRRRVTSPLSDNSRLGIRYNNTSDAPTTSNRTVNVVASDGLATSAAHTVTINVTAVNDAPVNTVPGTQSTNEDTSKVITGLSIADPDAGSGT